MHNSHTLEPKIYGKVTESLLDSQVSNKYPQLELVDFPGMFDSKGTVLEIAIDLAL